jgi:hypothetical protein
LSDTSYVQQSERHVSYFNESYQELYDQNINGGVSNVEAESKALGDATGGDKCGVNFSGGALFWFTVMTTIGT